MLKFVIRLSFLLFVLPISQAAAQDGGAESKGAMDWGFHVGRMLPNQLDGATEIVPSWGLYGSYMMDRFKFETGVINATGAGVDYLDLHFTLNMNMPVEDLYGIVFIGVDVIKYSGVSVAESVTGGAHIGGGILMPMAEGIWFRTDMKFNINPGVVMFINVGMTFDIGSSSK